MDIIIPKPSSPYRAMIAKGSGVVLQPRDTMDVIYYEGNLYGAVNLRSYEERIQCAAGRAHTRYPTVAMSGVFKNDLEQFVTVGCCDPQNGYRVTFNPQTEEIIEEWTRQ